MNATKTVAELEREVLALAASEIHIETNQGTYGAAEACRKCGTGDPAHANREVYERVGDGQQRHTGPAEDRAPGRMRRIGSAEMAEKRAELKRLRTELKATRRADR